MGQKIKKSPGQKSSWNQINQFHEKIFVQIFSMKVILSENTTKIPWYWFISFDEFFGLEFFKFSGPLFFSKVVE